MSPRSLGTCDPGECLLAETEKLLACINGSEARATQ
jgi:hypothetical protein